MESSIHLNKNSDIGVEKSNGLRSDTIINLGDLCRVFLTKDHLISLKYEIEKHLKN